MKFKRITALIVPIICLAALSTGCGSLPQLPFLHSSNPVVEEDPVPLFTFLGIDENEIEEKELESLFVYCSNHYCDYIYDAGVASEIWYQLEGISVTSQTDGIWEDGDIDFYYTWSDGTKTNFSFNTCDNVIGPESSDYGCVLASGGDDIVRQLIEDLDYYLYPQDE